MNPAILAYKKERESYANDHVGKTCWDTHCGGAVTVLLIADNKQMSEGREFVRVSKCEKCGKGWLFPTFEQWVKDKRSEIKYAKKHAREDLQRSKDQYGYAIAQARKDLKEARELYQSKLKYAAAIRDQLKTWGV